MRLGDDSRLSDRRVTEWFLLQKARREHETTQPVAVGDVLPVITISRQFGAGGHTVAEKVMSQLSSKWSLWDRELIEQIAASAHVRTEMVELLDERTQSWIDQMIRNMFSVRVMESQAYKHHLAVVVLALAQQGHKVILGRGANFVLASALNVRLEAAIEFRVQATMRRESISHDEAMKQVLHVDRDRADFTRGVFERDVEDRAAYDMVLQTDGLGYDAAAASIVSAARVILGDRI